MNIYVGNLAREATEEQLRQAFEAFGVVSTVSIIKDKFSGEPRGFGFVEMPSKEEATAALEGLNDKDVAGRAIKVNEAHERTARDSRGGGRGGPRRSGGFGGGGGGGGRGGYGGGGGGGRGGYGGGGDRGGDRGGNRYGSR
ncbi:MAG: RNA-binding protein [Phycisphaerae bacterium]|jgi:RNA recognition motif-containing protein